MNRSDEHQELDRYKDSLGEVAPGQEGFIMPEPPGERGEPRSKLGRLVDTVLRREPGREPVRPEAMRGGPVEHQRFGDRQAVPVTQPGPVSGREAELDRKLLLVEEKLALLEEGLPAMRPRGGLSGDRVEPPLLPGSHAKKAGFVVRVPEQELFVLREKLQETANTLHCLGARIDSIKPTDTRPH